MWFSKEHPSLNCKKHLECEQRACIFSMYGLENKAEHTSAERLGVVIQFLNA